MIRRITLVIAIISILFVPLYHLSFCEGELYQFSGAYVRYHFKNSSIDSVEYVVKKITGENMIVLREILYHNGTWEKHTYNDSLKSPEHFPVLPMEKIGEKRITIQNISFYFKSRENFKIGGKDYKALKYVHGNINGITTLIIDSSTGIILNASEFIDTPITRGYLWIAEIEDTNIKERSCMVEIAAVSIFFVSLGIFIYTLLRERRGKQ